MGKYSLLVTLGVAAAVSILTLQGEKTSQDTSAQQARRSAQVLARQVARTGYNAVLEKARRQQAPDASIDEIVSAVGTIQGEYDGGMYEAWLEKISPTAYKAVSIGRFPIMDRVVKYRIGDGYAENVPADAPEITKPSRLRLDFLRTGRTGYCSAVYLQRTMPETPPEEQPDPELLYPPSDEPRSATTYNKTIQPGTKLNFILAVYEKGYSDYNCGGREGENVPLDGNYYDQTYRSFEKSTKAELGSLRETPRSIIEEKKNEEGKTWRVAFEGYEAFSNEQLWDIKQNGYPTDVPVQQLPDVWRQEDTYGGNGWEKGPNGLLDLDAEGYQYRPDFNDEVFQVATMEPPNA